MGTEKKGEYGADQIQILEGLEAVRKRPGMYIGSTSAKGLHHLVYEIVDNAVDESLAGYCDTIYVTLNKDNSVTVRDNGRGIPVGMNKKKGVSSVEVVFTILHAGGKFGGGGYKVSGGLHGVGSSVVNALSNWLEVNVHTDGKIYNQRYEKGKVCYPLKVVGETELNGTEVSFLPDDTIFEETIFEYKVLRQRLRETAFLTKNLRIILRDDRQEEPVEEVFHYEGGIKEFVTYLNRGKEALYDQVIYCEGEKDGVYVEVAMQHNDSYNENSLSFVNNIITPEGGTHLSGFKNALTTTFNDYARKNKLLKENESNLSGEDIREGLTSVISIKLGELSLRDRQNKSLETAKPEEQSTALSMSSLPIFWNKIRQLQRLYVRKQFWRREPEMLPEKQEILPEGRLLWTGSACPENWRTVLTRILKTVRFISSRVILREVPQRRPDPVQPRQSFL